MIEILIVGMGLTGLFAACVSSAQGASVTLVSEGCGGLSVSHGCIDVWGSTTPLRSIKRLHLNHPYKLAGVKALNSAIEFLRIITTQNEYPYSGRLTRDLRLPTATGAVRTTTFAPFPLVAGDLREETPIVIAGFMRFRDFYPTLVATNLQRSGVEVQDVINLPLPNIPFRRDLYTIDLARLFDDPNWRSETIHTWKPILSGFKRLGLPAVLGLRRPRQVLDQIQDQLNVSIFEIPTLPPSVPGLRLEHILRRNIQQSGVRIIEGSRVLGRLDEKSNGRRVSGVVLETAGGPRIIETDAILLATGGLLHGGLIAHRSGFFQESVFNLPVMFDEGREKWTSLSPIQPQPYAKYGVTVNDRLMPVGAKGEPIFENLYAAGGILAGADRSKEGSRQGIDLSTAFRAVEVMLG